MPYVKRDAGLIVGESRWPHADFPEDIAETDPDYLGFVSKRTGPPARQKAPRASGNSIPALRADVNLIFDALVASGIIEEST